MKRYLLLGGAVVFWMLLPLRAQDPLTDAARREEAEQRYRELQTRLTQLEETLQTYQKRMNALTEELRSLREQMERLNSDQKSSAGQEESKRLAKAIDEVDRKRVQDNEKWLSEFSRLRDALTGKASLSPRPKSKPIPERSEKGYEYAIRKNDNLTKIVAALREQGIKVTQKQVEEANPDVDWKKLQIDQKIFIPAKPD